MERFGGTLRLSNQLPAIVDEIPTPGGLVLAADYKPKSIVELEGDLEALKLVDLDHEGLSEYKNLISNLKNDYLSTSSSTCVPMSSSGSSGALINARTKSTSSSDSHQCNGSQFLLANLINRVLKLVDRDAWKNVSAADTAAILHKLNSKLTKSYGHSELVQFFNQLDANCDGKLDLEEFKRAFLTL